MASSNDTNEVTTVQDVLKILPKHEQTLQVKMQDSRNRPSTNSPSYHTLRYGFKPASINSDEAATLELAQDGQVTIKAPNVGGSICTFKGHRRPHIKECLMIIDNKTGEVVLQKLTDNITVKATRTMGGISGNGNNLDNNNSSGNSNNTNNINNNSNGVPSLSSSSVVTASGSTASTNSNNSASNNTNSINNHSNHNNNNNHQHAASVDNGTTSISKSDGPQLSEESSDSSDDSSSSSGSSSSSSSSSSNNSSPKNEGFTF